MKKRVSLSFQIIGIASALVVSFILLYSFNLSFKEQVLIIYYKISPSETSYQSEILLCNDSNKVMDYFDKGILTITYKNGITDIYADICSGSVIKEYYCQFNNLKYQDYECEAGCYDGECLVPSEELSVIDENLSIFCGTYRITSPLNAIAQNEFSYYSALNSIDGDLSTHWFGDPAHPYPKWIYFDMGEKVCISEIDLYAFSQDIPLKGNIQASQDSVRWKTILYNQTISELSTTIKIPEIVTARYLRWYETSSNRSYGELTDIRLKVADLPEDKK